jgi:arylsulfatase A-like enzyme
MAKTHEISRRGFLGGLAALLAPMVLPGLGEAAGGRAKRWNVLWISCEDTSPDLGCYGDAYARTPNLDRLAGQGCRYTNAFVPYPVCAPTRSAVITGMWPSTIGTMHMRTSLRGYEAVVPEYVKCFSEYLRAAGYFCTNHTKTDYQFNAPFTVWDAGRDWRDRPGGTPFFSVINLTASHESKNWPKKNERLVHDPAEAPVPTYYPDTPVVRENIARYYDNVTEMDRQAGEILKRLDDDGLADETVVFFWGDHGRGLPRCKRWCYDSGIHVPLIVRQPGKIEAGTVCEDMISLIDLAPTVMGLARVRPPETMQGRAFLGPWKGKPREFIVAGRERMDANSYDHVRCIRDKRYKYIRNFMPEKAYTQPIPYQDKMPIMQEWRRLAAEGKLEGPAALFFRQRKPDEEFYDTQTDPDEVNSLIDAPEHQERIAKMRKQLVQWSQETGDLGGTPEPELIERMWPGGKQPVTAKPRVVVVPMGSGARRVAITCATPGASIGYRFAADKHWRLYSEPFEVRGNVTIEAKCIRIGYKESEAVTASSE